MTKETAMSLKITNFGTFYIPQKLLSDLSSPVNQNICSKFEDQLGSFQQMGSLIALAYLLQTLKQNKTKNNYTVPRVLQHPKRKYYLLSYGFALNPTEGHASEANICDM